MSGLQRILRGNLRRRGTIIPLESALVASRDLDRSPNLPHGKACLHGPHFRGGDGCVAHAGLRLGRLGAPTAASHGSNDARARAGAARRGCPVGAAAEKAHGPPGAGGERRAAERGLAFHWADATRRASCARLRLAHGRLEGQVPRLRQHFRAVPREVAQHPRAVRAQARQHGQGPPLAVPRLGSCASSLGS